ncbi:MAG: ribosomal small subunit methyltransferase [Bacillota bacterium]|jgi:16S rRNA (cytosine1402-N4)-methyltransferase
MNEHHSVLLTEVINGLQIRPNGIYLDLTIGRGGHASQIYEKLKLGRLLGFDQDATAIESLQNWQKNRPLASLHHTNFKHFTEVLNGLGIKKVDGILLDLGVSSPQFDVPERGFSYRFDGPLDMRMDQRQSMTAASILATSDIRTLTQYFREYADETFAFPIAKAIVNQRVNQPLKTTFELVNLIKKVKPAKALAKKGHPARQVFQALRMAVNQEVEVLKSVLESATSHLGLHGRLAVISFHSGEDRIVKQYFQTLTVSQGQRHGPERYLPVPAIAFKKIKPYPILPTEKEMKDNHRSESAVLRIIERVIDEK